MPRGALILCGGKSHRMGCDKASLPFGDGDTLLSAVVGQVRLAIPGGPIVCVAAADQELAPLPADVQIVHDAVPDQGPLAALAMGLAALEGKADAVFAIGCDAPLLAPAVVRLLFDQLSDTQAVVPIVDGVRQPLLAAYSTDVGATAAELVAASARSLQSLLDAVSLREVTTEQIQAADPPLHSLLNCNDQQTYEQALQLWKRESG